MIKTAQPYFKNKRLILKAVAEILASGRLMEGKYSREFEKRFAEYIGVRNAISVNSCTSALETVLKYIDVKDHEVIIPTNTFIATPNSVVYAGGKPIFADIQENNYCLDPEDLKRKITKRTKAVILVHLAGFITSGIEDIQKICKKNDLLLIEDCAHAHGATYKGKKAGSFGLAGCFSFYPTKIMTTGSGGMITTNDNRLDSFARSVRLHGRGKNLSDIVNFGNDWFLDEFHCALGLYQLDELNNMLKARRDVANKYINMLSDNQFIQLPDIPKGSKPAYYKFPLTITNRAVDVAKLKDVFKKHYGIDLESVYYPPSHLQPIYRKSKKRCLPVAEDILSRQICLPIHPLIKDKDIKYVIKALKAELKR